jgi:hypothetical protein
MRDEIDKILGKLIRKEISECNAIDELFDLFDVSNRALQKKYTEQISDINQWATLLLHNRAKLRERVMWAMIADIANRTTD